MRMWKNDLDTIYNEILVKHPDAIVAGDFNASPRHGLLSKIDTHEDVLAYLPFYKRGSWPVILPKPLRTSIDHILIPKGKYVVDSSKIYDLAGSDHAGVFTEISLIGD